MRNFIEDNDMYLNDCDGCECFDECYFDEDDYLGDEDFGFGVCCNGCEDYYDDEDLITVDDAYEMEDPELDCILDYASELHSNGICMQDAFDFVMNIWATAKDVGWEDHKDAIREFNEEME